jgi:hypothetical protein
MTYFFTKNSKKKSISQQKEKAGELHVANTVTA